MKHVTPDSMKFKRLARRLGSKVVAAGTLELLWTSTQKNAPQGDIGRLSNEEIAIECDWDDDPDLLVSSLVETGWIDTCDERRLIIHDWHEHAPRYLKANLSGRGLDIYRPVKLVTRAAPQPPRAQSGETTPSGSATSGQADRTEQAAISDPHKQAAYTGQADRTEQAAYADTTRNVTKRNVTKRNVSSCSEPKNSVAEPDDASGFEFPVKGKPKTWCLPRSKLDEWRETYDGLDVGGEISKARQWCRDNPKKRKTPQGMVAFLSNWLRRANDSGKFQPETDQAQQRNEYQNVLAEIEERRLRQEAAEQSRREAAAEKPPPRPRTGGLQKANGESLDGGDSKSVFERAISEPREGH